ncbi:histidine kinase [Streptococcus pneumoniae]|nr:histidine kinase [Streptococcus pneumoniae]SNM80861.1 histidine kinase [Streptococcus pneumoniae]
MLDWKQFFLAYLRSRSRLFIYLLSLAFLVLLFQFLFASLGIYFLYFFFLCCFVTILFFTWDILVETQVYRQELLYGEREAKSPLEIALAEKLEAREMELYQQRSKAERKLTDLLDYYTLWVHQIKTPIAASQLLVAEVVDRQLKQQLEQEIFKIDSYTNLVLQYLRLESFHDDLLLKQVQIEDLVKEIIRKYALFFIQKGLNVNLHDLDKEIVTDKKWLLVVI